MKTLLPLLLVALAMVGLVTFATQAPEAEAATLSGVTTCYVNASSTHAFVVTCDSTTGVATMEEYGRASSSDPWTHWGTTVNAGPQPKPYDGEYYNALDPWTVWIFDLDGSNGTATIEHGFTGSSDTYTGVGENLP